MSDFETIARPYSKAVFELAQEQGALQDWSNLLAAASQVGSDAAMRELIDSPAVEAADHAEIFLQVIEGLQDGPAVTDEFRNFIKLLAENGRLGALQEIALSYEAHKQAAEGAIEVQVASARKLTAKQEKEIVAKMAEKLGKEVTISSEVDESLIAGAIIHAGDLIIDGSARGRLDKLTTAIGK